MELYFKEGEIREVQPPPDLVSGASTGEDGETITLTGMIIDEGAFIGADITRHEDSSPTILENLGELRVDAFADCNFGTGHEIIFPNTTHTIKDRAFQNFEYTDNITFEIKGSGVSSPWAIGDRPKFGYDVFDIDLEPDEFMDLDSDFTIYWFIDPSQETVSLSREKYNMTYTSTGNSIGGYDEFGNPDPSVYNPIITEVLPSFSQRSGQLFVEWQAIKYTPEPTPYFIADDGFAIPPVIIENEERKLIVPLSDAVNYYGMWFRERRGFNGVVYTRENTGEEPKPVVVTNPLL